MSKRPSHIPLLFIAAAQVIFILLGDLAPATCRTFKVATYNVENLFDLVRNGTEYEEFVPGSIYGWNRKIAQKKYKNIARVLNDLAPDIVALEEVESARALVTLRNILRKKGRNYPYLAIASTKDTPVKCALMSIFPITRKEEIVVHEPGARNILKVTVSIEGRPLILFVNHWKSKNGPESMRIPYAKALRKAIDRLKGDVDFIVLGDFNSNYNEYKTFRYSSQLNDTHGITGINHILGTIIDHKLVDEEILTSQRSNRYLYNLWLELNRKNRWSYLFFKKKETPDNIIVPKGLYDSHGISYVDNSFNSFRPRYLFYKWGIYRWQRADRGEGRHLGRGFSDHIPIYAFFSTDPFRFDKNHKVSKLEEKIDLNTANVRELISIDGIGPVLANRIIEARPYKKVDDLLKVKGIGKKRLEKIRPYLVVRP